jgi:Asp/Glu/hydantoin racemase
LSPRIFLIHATPAAVEPVNDAFDRLWPQARRSNLLDDSLSSDLAQSGRLDECMTARFLALSRYAANAGANGILFTCSAFAPAIDACKAQLSIPVLKPDEAMIERALSGGGRIAVLATFEPSVAAALASFREAADRMGMHADVESIFVAGAFDAKKRDDVATHDALIAAAASTAAARCDVICFAQFSMASAASQAQAAAGKRVLTSADSAVAKMKQLVTA